MSEANKEWVEVLSRPSETLSTGSFLVGSWMAFLTVINITIGAYSEGRKVNWIAFITNGSNTNSAHEIGLTLPDDLVFGILSMALIAAGIVGIGSSRENGLRGWLSSLPEDRIVTSIYSPQKNLTRTIASWMILSGLCYYFVWSTMEATWVDPGVYSVMIALVSMGIGIHWIQDSGKDD